MPAATTTRKPTTPDEVFRREMDTLGKTLSPHPFRPCLVACFDKRTEASDAIRAGFAVGLVLDFEPIGAVYVVFRRV